MAFNFTTAVPTIRNWGGAANLRLQELDEAVQSTQAMISNIPGPGVQLITFANTDATLGVGGDLWEMRIVKSNANRYVWDPDTDTWLLCAGNIYAAAGNIPGAVTLIAGNTAIIAGALWRWDGTQWIDDITAQPGYYRRARFEISATGNDYIKLTGGRYHIDGVGIVYNAGTIDYHLTSLATGVWSYIYIYESTLTGPGAITSANLIDSTTAPTYSTSKGGWYNGADRCIFMVNGTGSAAYRPFTYSNELVQWLEYVVLIDGVTNTAWVATTVGPPIKHASDITISARYITGGGSMYAGSDGVYKTLIATAASSNDHAHSSAVIVTNGSGQVYTRCNNTDITQYLIVRGFLLPEGI